MGEKNQVCHHRVDAFFFLRGNGRSDTYKTKECRDEWDLGRDRLSFQQLQQSTTKFRWSRRQRGRNTHTNAHDSRVLACLSGWVDNSESICKNEGITRTEWDGAKSRWAYDTNEKQKKRTTKISTLRGGGEEKTRKIKRIGNHQWKLKKNITRTCCTDHRKDF